MSAVSPLTVSPVTATAARTIHLLSICRLLSMPAPCAPFGCNGTCIEGHFIRIPMQILEWRPRLLAAHGTRRRLPPLIAQFPAREILDAPHRRPHYSGCCADRG